MIEVINYVYNQLKTLDINISKGSPNLNKTQSDKQLFVLNYEFVNKQTDMCNRVTNDYNILIKGVTPTLNRNNDTEFNDEYDNIHNKLIEIGDYLNSLTNKGSVKLDKNTISVFKNYELKDLGSDVSGRYVIELRVPIIWLNSVQ